MINLIETKKISFISGLKLFFEAIKSTVTTKESYLFISLFFIFSYFAIDIKEYSLSMMDSAPINDNGELGVNFPILLTLVYVFIFSFFKLFSPIILANYKNGKTILKSFLVTISPKLIGRFILSVLSTLLLFLVIYKVFNLDGDTSILIEKITQHKNGENVHFSEDFQNQFIIKAFLTTFIMFLFLSVISFSYYVTFVLNKGVGFIESMKLSVIGFAKNVLPFLTLSILLIGLIIGIEELKLMVNNIFFTLIINSFVFVIAINIWEIFSKQTFVESDV